MYSDGFFVNLMYLYFLSFETVYLYKPYTSGAINGEFYIDSLINDAIGLGLQCHLFEVDSYLCWGTPNDLRTFEYWQSCFHKWTSHPYRLELDARVPSDQVDSLAKRYQATIPKLLGAVS